MAIGADRGLAAAGPIYRGGRRVEELGDHIRRIVEAAPPLTAEQRDRLALLLRGSRADLIGPRLAPSRTGEIDAHEPLPCEAGRGPCCASAGQAALLGVVRRVDSTSSATAGPIDE